MNRHSVMRPSLACTASGRKPDSAVTKRRWWLSSALPRRSHTEKCHITGRLEVPQSAISIRR